MTPETEDARLTAANLHFLASIFEGHAIALTDERLRDAYNEAVLRLTDAAEALERAWQEVAGVWEVPVEQAVMEWLQ